MIYLSICIPTFQRIDITRKTITSIYSDLEGVNIDEFEVIVSDNDVSESSRCFEKEFTYKNFHYYQTKCEGFLNSYYVLGYGNGLFLKLHNNYTMLRPGALKYMIDEVKRYERKKSLMFFTNGLLGVKKKNEYDSFNLFMNNLSYFSSASTGFGIWRDDYEMIKDTVKINKWFPQTSMLLLFNKKNEYILNDLVIFKDQKVPKKGGYNPYKVFGIEYLTIIKKSLDDGNISEKTFDKIKKRLLRDYLASRYFKTVIAHMDKFEHDNIRKHLNVYYSSNDFFVLLWYAFLAPIKHLKKKLS